jgi:hypothetical protein
MCNPAITAAIPAARRHSDGDIDALIRLSRDGRDDDKDEASIRRSYPWLGHRQAVLGRTTKLLAMAWLLQDGGN